MANASERGATSPDARPGATGSGGPELSLVVRGVLFWNVWGKVDAARELIAERGPIAPEHLKGGIS